MSQNNDGDPQAGAKSGSLGAPWPVHPSYLQHSPCPAGQAGKALALSNWQEKVPAHSRPSRRRKC